MADHRIITTVLDKYFDFCREPGEEYSLAAPTEQIPGIMLDDSRPEDANGYSFWLPIASRVNDKDLSAVENFFHHPLPPSYKYFLQQHYFLELPLHDDSPFYIDFFYNLPSALLAVFNEKVEKYYSALPGRNYLPFADYVNYGVLAFDANEPAAGNEYKIVLLNHEDDYSRPIFYAAGFTEMFHGLEKNLDESIKQITSYRDNS